jgi:Right handed beta helix region
MRRVFLASLASAGLLWMTLNSGHRQPRNAVANSAGILSAHPQTSGDDSESHVYYVDCRSSRAQGDGHSPEGAWNTLVPVNAHTFLPGDTIRLKRGTECPGRLWPKGSGSPSKPIRLSAYGTGPRPQVVAEKDAEEAFKLFDQEYWDIDSLEFSGGTLFGVYVSGQTGILHHIHVRNLLVHDVYGSEVKHKESGLVVISPGKVDQHFDDVLVDGVTAYGTDQWAGILVGGGNFGEVAEKDWNTNVIVRNSEVDDVYGDGIILFRVKNGVIDGSSAWHIGMQPTQSIGTPNAIWTWMCSDCVVSNNEAFLTDSPGVDGGAFDIDYGNSRNSVVRNFAHDTQGYCIAVFGAGYVTHDSVVEGNLCINNGRSPRMARYQGAIFLWTWNNGVIENLRVEKNTIFWSPPGDFPALLNHADIRGSERLFRQNQIYSSSPRMIDSDKNIALQDNRYVSCGVDRARWGFDHKTYDTFEKYRNASGEDTEGAWTIDRAFASCLPEQRGTRKESVTDGQDKTRKTASLAYSLSGWTITSEFPASIDEQGLLDAASMKQVVVLKNQYLQFWASGLRIKITLDLQPGAADEVIRNAVGDLSANGLSISMRPAADASPRARMCLVTPRGSIAKRWDGYVGPTEIGLALRKFLSVPLYSQIESPGLKRAGDLGNVGLKEEEPFFSQKPGLLLIAKPCS